MLTDEQLNTFLGLLSGAGVIGTDKSRVIAACIIWAYLHQEMSEALYIKFTDDCSEFMINKILFYRALGFTVIPTEDWCEEIPWIVTSRRDSEDFDWEIYKMLFGRTDSLTPLDLAVSNYEKNTKEHLYNIYGVSEIATKELTYTGRE